MLHLLSQKAFAGVDVRILNKGQSCGLNAQKYPGKRLHVRAIVRDGKRAFVGSQSLRALELDHRREIGAIISDGPTVKRMAQTFESDWALTPAAREAAVEGSTPADAVAATEELTPTLAD